MRLSATVRSCDGKYFPPMHGVASAAQMCQAFCPASPTKVFFGSAIDSAYAANGERYADSENAFAYRKALRADCTCNGRNPAGLALVDLAMDGSLRAGDVVATTDGLVLFRHPGRQRPEPGFHAGGVFSGLDAGRTSVARPGERTISRHSTWRWRKHWPKLNSRCRWRSARPSCRPRAENVAVSFQR
jgi:hypothetical protein